VAKIICGTPFSDLKTLSSGLFKGNGMGTG